jgi:hypothetical protein
LKEKAFAPGQEPLGVLWTISLLRTKKETFRPADFPALLFCRQETKFIASHPSSELFKSEDKFDVW